MSQSLEFVATDLVIRRPSCPLAAEKYNHTRNYGSKTCSVENLKAAPSRKRRFYKARFWQTSHSRSARLVVTAFNSSWTQCADESISQHRIRLYSRRTEFLKSIL